VKQNKNKKIDTFGIEEKEEIRKTKTQRIKMLKRAT